MSYHAIKSILVTVALLLGHCLQPAIAETRSPRYASDIPAKITTPDSVKTRLGTLRFFDGMPDQKTVQLAYDNLDFQRGVSTFLNTIPIASLYGMREGLRSIGVTQYNQVSIYENLLDARSTFLTGNTTVNYLFGWLDLKDGPLVVEVPPKVMALVDDFTFLYVTDLGMVGPDRGQGGKYLFLPPGYDSEVPDGYFVKRSPTYGNWLGLRAFPTAADPQAGVKNVKRGLKIYRLADAANPPAMEFINSTGKVLNTVHANNFDFFQEVNAVIQEEPASAFNPETLGLLSAIGIKKGQPFKPDARLKKILTDAAAVANATVRAISYSSRDKEIYFYDDRQWNSPFARGSHEFIDNGARVLDDRSYFHYVATGITPAMAKSAVGKGTAYALTAKDADGNYLDGGKTYKIDLPSLIPAKNFWSFMVYSGQTRSILQTDQRFAGVDSNKEDLQLNDDGSVTVYFGPKAPVGKESNWIQTLPNKSYSCIFRLYGPLQPWFDKSWKPGDFELLE